MLLCLFDVLQVSWLFEFECMSSNCSLKESVDSYPSLYSALLSMTSPIELCPQFKALLEKEGVPENFMKCWRPPMFV